MAYGVAAARLGRRETAFGAGTERAAFAPAADRTGDGTAFPEIDCLRGRLSPAALEDAQRRAARVGVGADRVLIAAGLIDEDSYLRALGDSLGVDFEPLDGVARAQCPVDDERLIESAAAGLLPLMLDEGLCLAVAPRGEAARRIATMIKDNPVLAQRFRLTSAERLNRYVLRSTGKALTERAAGWLKHNFPMLAAGPPHRLANLLRPALCVLTLLAAFALAPATARATFEILLAAAFLAWLALRLVSIVADRAAAEPPPEPPDDELPVYTVIAALYREAACVDGLLTAIERLDYPREKLEVLIAVEADDRETCAALTARRHRVPVTVIPVPAGAPRTKPKALNVALPFARGTFTVVYDAEDRPQPSQLRCALRAFRAGGETLACVQARLCIDNTADGWLARFFTAEYAGQFDVFLPGIATLRLPLPLGGSSNHFHTATLREVGGWDAYNVTEDADLGMRLARFGYRAVVIDSTTYEEAPARLGAWLRQRTRWFKGWMQTWLVHMRRPWRLLRELGLGGFLGFQLLVGGNVLAALVHPLFLGGFIYSLASGTPMWRGDSVPTDVLAGLYGATIVTGYLTSAVLGWLGLVRRGLPATAWVLLATPLHWLLLSLAAWRALYQLLTAPYAWEKTEHGLAKSSRSGAEMTRLLLELERHLTFLARRGKLPNLQDKSKSTRAGRPTPDIAAA